MLTVVAGLRIGSLMRSTNMEDLDSACFFAISFGGPGSSVGKNRSEKRHNTEIEELEPPEKHTSLT
jgi:hypothetical protein